MIALRGREPNPVLVKELRARFRGPRAFAALTSFLLLLVLFAYLLYAVQVRQLGWMGGYGTPVDAAAAIGRTIFTAVAFMELVFMAFIGPALSLNAISGEVERQTYEMLLATPLSGWQILGGKVGAALAYVLLLIFSALPVISLAFLFGGVSALAVVQSQLAVFVAGAVFVMLGIFASAMARRTARAAVLSYLTAGVLCVSPVLFIFFTEALDLWSGGSSQTVSALAMSVSPFAALVSITAIAFGAGGSQHLFWAQSLVIQAAICGFLFVVAATRIRPVGRAAILPLLLVAALVGLWAFWVVLVPPF